MKQYKPSQRIFISSKSNMPTKSTKFTKKPVPKNTNDDSHESDTEDQPTDEEFTVVEHESRDMYDEFMKTEVQGPNGKNVPLSRRPINFATLQELTLTVLGWFAFMERHPDNTANKYVLDKFSFLKEDAERINTAYLKEVKYLKTGANDSHAVALFDRRTYVEKIKGENPEDFTARLEEKFGARTTFVDRDGKEITQFPNLYTSVKNFRNLVISFYSAVESAVEAHTRDLKDNETTFNNCCFTVTREGSGFVRARTQLSTPNFVTDLTMLSEVLDDLREHFSKDWRELDEVCAENSRLKEEFYEARKNEARENGKTVYHGGRGHFKKTSKTTTSDAPQKGASTKKTRKAPSNKFSGLNTE